MKDCACVVFFTTATLGLEQLWDKELLCHALDNFIDALCAG